MIFCGTNPLRRPVTRGYRPVPGRGDRAREPAPKAVAIGVYVTINKAITPPRAERVPMVGQKAPLEPSESGGSVVERQIGGQPRGGSGAIRVAPAAAGRPHTENTGPSRRGPARRNGVSDRPTGRHNLRGGPSRVSTGRRRNICRRGRTSYNTFGSRRQQIIYNLVNYSHSVVDGRPSGSVPSRDVVCRPKPRPHSDPDGEGYDGRN